MTCIRAVLAVCAVALTGTIASQANAASLAALTAQDAQLYASAFQAAERGDIATVDTTLARVSDPCLVGRVQYVKLTTPASRGASYTDLVGWLSAFKDLPGADKIYALAMKLKPQGAEPPAPVVLVDGEGARGRASPKSQAARDAYFNGDLSRALTLARSSGDIWFAGLAAYRLGQFTDSLGFFEAVARNTGESDAARAGGAFWAARAAEAAGLSDRIPGLLHISAARPDTFYGMIAVRRLELSDDPLGRAIEAAIPATPPVAAASQATRIDASGMESPSVIRLIRTDARARRAVALMQVGRPLDAGWELRTGLALADGEDDRAAWTTLIFAPNPNRDPSSKIAAHAPTGQSAVYPVPALSPVGGFTVNKALVYAVTWQESRFDSLAVSPVGALGLMQVMPATAASAAGDDGLRGDPLPLLDPATNLRVGQQYLNYLMGRGATGGDLLRVVAAYNGGEALLSRTQAALGPDADSLLVVESMPFYETRAYVQKVVAAYWSYRPQFGQPAPTLDPAASGARLIDARLDR